MKIGNTLTMFSILLTTEDRNMLGTDQLMMYVDVAGEENFIHFYRLHHPHARGERVSVLANPGGKDHPYRIILTKTSSNGKWKHLKTLPKFGPEFVHFGPDEQSGHDPWTASRPAMTTEVKSGRGPAKQPQTTAALARLPPPAESTLPKVLPQIMSREEFSETAIYRDLQTGLALVNKAMAFYGPRLTVIERDSRLVALLELNGE